MQKYIGDRAFYRRLFSVMLPILIQSVITNFVNLLDNVMVGQVGTEPMSGVAIVNQLLFVFNLCIFGGLAGAGIFTAQYYGAGDDKGVADSFRAKLYIAFGAVLCFAAIFLTAGETLIAQFIHEGNEALDLAATMRHAKDYLAIMLVQLPPFALQMAYSSTLRETGETLLPMKAGIAAVLVNLTLNYILIFGKLGAPALGVEGAAIATVIARFTECGIIVLWTHRHRERNRFLDTAFKTWRIPGSLLRAVAVTGLPLLANELLWSSGMTFLGQCYSMRGLEAVSADNICRTISNLFFCAFLSMGNAIATHRLRRRAVHAGRRADGAGRARRAAHLQHHRRGPASGRTAPAADGRVHALPRLRQRLLLHAARRRPRRDHLRVRQRLAVGDRAAAGLRALALYRRADPADGRRRPGGGERQVLPRLRLCQAPRLGARSGERNKKVRRNP